MKPYLLLIALFLSNVVDSKTLTVANNKEEAIGIIFGVLKEIDVIKFMCERKVQDQSGLISKSVNSWMQRNNNLVSKLVEGLEEIPSKDLQELQTLAKKVSRNMIIQFNVLDEKQRNQTCISFAKKLDDDVFMNQYPKAVGYLK